MKLDRMFWQWIFGILFIMWIIISAPKLDFLNVWFCVVGILCIFVGIIGRLYSTLYIGGMKNEGKDGKSFVNDGIYRVCRNPLYFFSFIGFLGLLFLKGQILFVIIGGALFLVIYRFTIKKEEAFLKDKFGKSYEQFLKEVPRFFPDFSRFKYEDKLEIRPFFLHKELKRTIGWILGALFIFIISYLQSFGILPVFFKIF